MKAKKENRKNNSGKTNGPNRDFRNSLITEFEKFVLEQSLRFPEKNRLRIDLHCHDHNSDVPDEILGRLLEIPETWLQTDELISALERNGCDTFTITNHNNARSCYELQDKGRDILTGAEFTCFVPDFNIWIHTLAYGFNPEQEVRLNKYRNDLYKFLRYTADQDIPVIWAHPLYYYSLRGIPPIQFFEKLSVVFERFEVVNGQRNTRQNLLIHKWVEKLTPSRLSRYAKEFKIKPEDYCRNKGKKSFSGGSDSHMGIFPGLTGSYLHVPDLDLRLQTSGRADLALEAIRKGDMAPYGTHNESERLMVAFLDYFCQIGINMKDPGLIRILLHKGEPVEKIQAMILGNVLLELKHHKVTMGFLNTFHECFQGKVPGLSRKMLIKPVYRKIFNIARNIAVVRRDTPEKLTPEYLNTAVENTSTMLNGIFFERLQKKMTTMMSSGTFENSNLEELVRSLELPLGIHSYSDTGKTGKGKGKMDMQQFLDGLSFPFLGSAIMYAAAFTSTRVLNTSRPLLDTMSKKLGFFEQPGRALWITDTFSDKNGVAHSLREIHEEIKRRNLPIDLLVCENGVEPDDHLIVLPPAFEFTLPFYKQQPFRIPDIMQVHKIFSEGSYDRLISSTEGPMGMLGLLLKKAYSVPASFFLHTDWLTFAKMNLGTDAHMINRIRRILRALYRQYDSIFVLNEDQRKWLSGKEFGIDRKKIFKTAHWADAKFRPGKARATELFGTGEKDRILLFTGRISHEKGVMDLPYIYEMVRKEIPDMKIVAVGSGPAEEELRRAIPDLIHIPWVDHDKLPDIYSSADLLILPSSFDTFGRVIVEAMSCGLPVAAYDIMGPGEIIENGKSGYLGRNKKDLGELITGHFETSTEKRFKMRKNAVDRSQKYQRDPIMKEFIRDLNF